MLRALSLFFTVVIFSLLEVSCSDDSSDTDYLFDHAVQDLSVLRLCAADADSGAACYQLRFRIPIETSGLQRFHVWVDTLYVNDSASSLPSHATDYSIQLAYDSNSTSLYDTLDLTEALESYLERDSVHVAIWCEYSDDSEGALQHLYVHFGDDMSPSTVTIQDSVWTTGVVLDWTRPTDQTDYYETSELSGPIVGYNLVLYAEDTSEDIRDVRLKLEWNGGVDSLGDTGYRRHARYRANNDSIWLDTIAHGESVKNYLRFAVIDGEGFDFSDEDANSFRVTIEGLRAESNYTIGITAWDSAGNSSSGSSGDVTSNQLFITTDSIAPLMPEKLWVRADTLYPDYARLDSNRVLIYWSRSVDPLVADAGITVDSVLTIPAGCLEILGCYKEVQTYMVELWNGEEWETATEAGGESEEKYTESYVLSGDSMKESISGTYVVDTLRWVVPSDTLIVRIRSVDSSGYYSTALIDTIAVTPGPEADLDCPEGYVPVRTSDTTRFCVEKYEHQDTDSTFMHNVFYAEAVNACASLSASGFTFSLCKIKDWEKACTARGQVSYGVIEETDFSASEFLFSYCNAGTDDSTASSLLSGRSSKCVTPDGVHDMPGSYQEWVIGPDEDTLEVLKGTSYALFSGEDRSGLAKCSTRSYPYRVRAAFTKDTVYLYRNASKVDTTTTKDTSRTLYAMLTQKDFTDTLQYFNVIDPATGTVLGRDYLPLAEYRNGGETLLNKIANGLTYEEDSTDVVFLLGETTNYLAAAAFYQDPTIGFRCCAYPDDE